MYIRYNSWNNCYRTLNIYKYFCPIIDDTFLSRLYALNVSTIMGQTLYTYDLSLPPSHNKWDILCNDYY